MKGIKLIRGQTHLEGNPPEPHARNFPLKLHVEMGDDLSPASILSSPQSDCARSLFRSSIPFRAFVMYSPLELIITAMKATSPISIPYRQPDLGVQYQLWSKVIQGIASLPHQWVGSQGLGHLRANLGFGIFWLIPPLLVVAYPRPTFFIGRIYFGLSGVGLAWVQTR